MKVAIYTLGCKVNQYETQAMEQTLRAKGHQVVEFSDEADAYVVNTCSVTAVSDQKSRQVIHRVQKQHPAAVVAVCGCYPQTHAEAVRELEVDLIAGTGDREGFVTLLEEAAAECRTYGVEAPVPATGRGSFPCLRRLPPERKIWRPLTSPLSGGCLRCCLPAAWRAAPAPC